MMIISSICIFYIDIYIASSDVDMISNQGYNLWSDATLTMLLQNCVSSVSRGAQ